VFSRRSIVVPIGKLTSATEKMARGDYEQRAEVATADEIGQLADGFNSMAVQLQRTLESLEQRGVDLQRRSLQMQASAEVSRAATSILDTDQLIRQVVGLIRERFGLYYVGLFLTDEMGEWAVLRAGTGMAGQTMLARGHRIKVGEGMIGWCIEHGQARVVEEVGADAVRLATPELPDTRSEAALVLRSRGRVLGALTIQSEHPGALDDQRITVLQTLADQVAIAIDNANLFAESRAALEAERRAYGEMSLAAWAEVLRGRGTIGYRCDADAVVPLMGSVTVEDGGLPALDIPIIIHDQVIGTIRARKPKGAGQWTGEETGLVQALAEQLSIALESARLYRDTQRRAARERLLGEATGRIRETLDMETVLRTAVDQVQQALGLDRIVIRLLTEEDSDSARGRM
jgi:GAF domain-containing protein/HAMP domain-containing protein